VGQRAAVLAGSHLHHLGIARRLQGEGVGDLAVPTVRPPARRTVIDDDPVRLGAGRRAALGYVFLARAWIRRLSIIARRAPSSTSSPTPALARIQAIASRMVSASVVAVSST